MEIVREELLLKAKIFSVANLYLKKSDGETVLHSVIRFVDTISVLPVTKQGTILLEKQYRSPINQWLLEIPAGKIDPGETPEETMLRELEEEIGCRAKSWRKLFEGYVSCGYTDEKMYYYIAEVEPVSEEERRAFPDHDEEIEIIEVSVEEALNMIARFEIIDAKTILMVTAYAREKAI